VVVVIVVVFVVVVALVVVVVVVQVLRLTITVKEGSSCRVKLSACESRKQKKPPPVINCACTHCGSE